MRSYGLSFRSATNVCTSEAFSFAPMVLRFIGGPCHTSWTALTFVCYCHFWIGSRYIYDLYYEKEAISKQLYDWLLKNNYADANLIAKWKKQGYEKVCPRIIFLPSLYNDVMNLRLSDCYLAMGPLGIIANFSCQLCCLRCVQTKETNFNSTCICRVPKAQLKDEQTIQCVSCGCRGCASSD